MSLLYTRCTNLIYAVPRLILPSIWRGRNYLPYFHTMELSFPETDWMTCPRSHSRSYRRDRTQSNLLCPVRPYSAIPTTCSQAWCRINVFFHPTIFVLFWVSSVKSQVWKNPILLHSLPSYEGIVLPASVLHGIFWGWLQPSIPQSS